LLVLGGLVMSSGRAEAQQSGPVREFFQAVRSGRVQVVDLTHPLDERTPYWPEGVSRSPFHTSLAETFERDGYFARSLTLPEHFGTHMDAPAHFDPEGLTVDQLSVENFLAPAVVVDVSEAAKSNPDYRVSVADLENWQKEHGAIPPRAVVLFNTGWGARWSSQKDYMNQDAHGVLHFPGLSAEAARHLLERAHPLGIGIDTASIDCGSSKDFPVHHLTMAAGLYHLESVANLDRLPAVGAYVVALPLKLTGGSGSPARVLAFYSTAQPAAH
jgi:kynurenine formamidase